MMLLAALLTPFTPQVGDQQPTESPVLPQYYLPRTHRATLSEISIGVHVDSVKNGASGTVTVPVPGDYSGQTLIEFKVTCEPPSALKTWTLAARPDEINKVLIAIVEPPLGGAKLAYQARVLVPGFEVTRTSKKNFDAWLGPSSLVQSGAPEITSLAKTLRAAYPDREALVEKTVKYVANIKPGQTAPFDKLDAVSALSVGGNSLARSNLCAALLRANGIAARTIAHIPTYAEGMEAEHWLTEYGGTDGNWQMVDPTVGLLSPARNSVLVLSISSLSDEQSPGKPRACLAPGSPYLSTATVSGGLTISSATKFPLGATSHVIQSFPPPAGARLMSGAYRRSRKVIASGAEGRAEWFDETQFRDALSKGPINLALFLDGQPTFPRH